MPGRPSSSTPLRARVAVVLACLCLSCADGTGPTGGRNAPLDLRPQFQIDPDLFPSAPIDHIRLTAKEVETSQVVGAADLPVDPQAAEWTLTFAVDLGDATSLAVIVEVELMAGQTVEWSGRIGPIAVGNSGTPQIRSVDIHRGPLENLDVLAVSIQGTPTEMNVGTSATLAAELTLPEGMETSPTVYWATTDPTVATITSTGATAVLTAVGAGTVDVVATSGAAHDQVTVTMVEIAPPGYDVEWRGTNPDWFDAANWSTGAVPLDEDDVYIAVAAAYPELFTDVTTGSLGIEEGASITLGDALITVNGNLDAAGTILGGGSVVLAGTDATVRGSLEAYLDVSGTASASGPVEALGMFLAGTGARFDVAGQTVTLQGPLFTTQGATIAMSGGTLEATDVTFDGGSTEGMLTGGTLRVLGAFTASGDPLSFAASGTHTVVFAGAQTQQISFSDPGAQTQRFARLTVASGAQVIAASAFAATGDVDVDGALSVGAVAATACCTVSVSGTLGVQQGGTLTIGAELVLELGSSLVVFGTVDVPTCTNLGGTLGGDGTHPCEPPQGSIRTWTGAIDSNWHEPGNWNPSGTPGPTDDVVIGSGPVMVALDVTVGSLAMQGTAMVDLGGFTLTVEGGLTQAQGVSGIWNGLVILTGPGTGFGGRYPNLELRVDRTLTDHLYLTGSLTIADADLDVRSYQLYVQESLTVTGDNAHLVMTDSDGVVSVLGNAEFDGGDHAGALTAGTLGVWGDFTVSSRTPTSFAADPQHQLVLGGDTSDQRVSFALPGPTQQRIGTLTLQGGGERTTLTTDVHATGDVNVGGWLTVPTNVNLSIEGTLNASFGGILQVDGGATVTAPSCFFSTPPIIFGNGEQPCTEAPYPVTLVWVGGSASQAEAWEDPVNWEPVPGASGDGPGPDDYVLVPNRWTWPMLRADAVVAGFVSSPGATVDLGGFTLEVQGDAMSGRAPLAGEVRVSGQDARLEGYFGDLRVLGTRTLSSTLIAEGSLYVEAPLVIGPQVAAVQSDLIVSAAGALDMRIGDGSVSVGGNAVFDGASHARLLATGSLYVEGDFIADCRQASDCFVSDGTAVYFATPQSGQAIRLSDSQAQVFQTVYAGGAVGSTVTLESPIVVGDLNTAAGLTFRAAQPGLASIEVRGTASVIQTTFDGVRLEINTTIVNGPWADDHLLDRLTFTNMPQDVIQLYVRSATDPASGVPLTLSSPVFESPPGVNGSYLRGENAMPTNGTLVINVTNPTPATADGLWTVDQFTQVLWPGQ